MVIWHLIKKNYWNIERTTVGSRPVNVFCRKINSRVISFVNGSGKKRIDFSDTETNQ
jgi:hypothetical protein